MSSDKKTEDVRTIKAVIDRQFKSLHWSEGAGGNWTTFAADFFPDAALFPSARPVKRQSVTAFVERMQGLAAGSLHSFHERMLGSEIRVFGNVAVAMAGCEIIENGRKEVRGVEAMLLVKEEGAWKIVAQGWDMESDENEIPGHLLSYDG